VNLNTQQAITNSLVNIAVSKVNT